MPRKPQVNFRLKPEGKDGFSNIVLDFAYQKRRLRYEFGQSVKPNDWNNKKQRVKNKQTTTNDGKFALNDMLDNLEVTCLRTYSESLKDGIPDPNILKRTLDLLIDKNHNNTEVSNKPTLFSLAQRFIDGEIKFKGKDKSQSSLDNYSAVTKHLREYQVYSKFRVDFDTIDLDFFYSYVSYLKNNKKLSVNTIAKDISIIKVFMGEAVDLEYTDNMKFKHKKFAYNEEETDHVYLTEEELTKLYELKIANKKLDEVRDLFVFGAWVGVRFSDFSNIKPENIVKIEGDYFIKMITQKTKELVIIPCNPVVVEIFEKYADRVNKLPKTISNQKFNDYIKDVCKLAKFTEKGRVSAKPKETLAGLVSSHTARRSFATNYYLQGFPTLDLMKITGHKTERSFLKYIRVSKLDTAKRLSAHIKEKWSKKLLAVD
ncbi:MAG: site-specific integrase [Bacteroidetes bacterium]|nr:site-specific integrase [Bacteroidota bacterium]